MGDCLGTPSKAGMSSGADAAYRRGDRVKMGTLVVIVKPRYLSQVLCFQRETRCEQRNVILAFCLLVNQKHNEIKILYF